MPSKWDWQKQCMIEVECASALIEQLEQENSALRLDVDRLSAALCVLTDKRRKTPNATED